MFSQQYIIVGLQLELNLSSSFAITATGGLIIFSIKSHRGISDHILDIQVPGITGIEFAQSIQYGF